MSDATARSARCLACSSGESHALGYWDRVPLSVLGLPRSREEARDQARFVLDVRRCARCGHVYHTRFDEHAIPYEKSSNLMFNLGRSWLAYQDALALDWTERFGLVGKRVVEIGAGEGGFLARFRAAGCRCEAWEPGPDAERCEARGIATRRAYFTEASVAESRPDAIVCRHVLEHLADPHALLEAIRRGSRASGIAPLFLAEVPRIENALAQRRINDFLYEHVSHFTDASLRVLFESAGWEVLEVRPGYRGEVVTLAARPRERGAARPAPPPPGVEEECRRFRESVRRQIAAVRATLEGWRRDGERFALWGATGKGAALTNLFGLDPEIAPLVIDSDARKQGAFVPGTGQRIDSPEACREVDRILICTQWRARDIEHEIREEHGLRARLHVYHRESVVPLTPELEI